MGRLHQAVDRGADARTDEPDTQEIRPLAFVGVVMKGRLTNAVYKALEDVTELPFVRTIDVARRRVPDRGFQELLWIATPSASCTCRFRPRRSGRRPRRRPSSPARRPRRPSRPTAKESPRPTTAARFPRGRSSTSSNPGRSTRKRSAWNCPPNNTASPAGCGCGSSAARAWCGSRRSSGRASKSRGTPSRAA